MSSTKMLTIGAVPIILIGFLIFGRGSLEISFDQASEKKEQANALLSSDRYSKKHPLPTTLKLRPGRHTIELQAKGAETYIEKVWILPFSSKKIIASFVDEEVPNRSDIVEIPYLRLFPHETGDYIITITIGESNSKRVPTGIIIGVFHRFASPSDGALYTQERELAIKNAKDWLAANKIPADIPITITDTPTNN